MSVNVAFFIVAVVAIFILVYRSAHGDNVYKYV